MTNEVKRLKELMKTDKGFQRSLRHAIDRYDGEHTEEAEFYGIVAPVAMKYGIHVTFAEFKETEQETNRME